MNRPTIALVVDALVYFQCRKPTFRLHDGGQRRSIDFLATRMQSRKRNIYTMIGICLQPCCMVLLKLSGRIVRRLPQQWRRERRA